MFYFSPVEDDHLEETKSQLVSSPEPSTNRSEWVQERDTIKYQSLNSMADSHRSHMDDLMKRVESLSNYTRICYETPTDVRPFGPEILFQLKWCREFWIRMENETHYVADLSGEIYAEYRDCVRILLRAAKVAYEIKNPIEYADMVDRNLSLFEYIFNVPELAYTDENWILHEKYYFGLEELYYMTLNVRDEMEFGM